MEPRDYVRGAFWSQSEGFSLIESFYISKMGAEELYRGSGMSKLRFKLTPVWILASP
jgi:hypothetical protein